MEGLISCSQRGALEVVVCSPEDQVFSEPILNAFEIKTGIALKAGYGTEETKSTGTINCPIVKQTNLPKSDNPCRAAHTNTRITAV